MLLLTIQHFQDIVALTGQVLHKRPKNPFSQCDQTFALCFEQNRVKLCLALIQLKLDRYWRVREVHTAQEVLPSGLALTECINKRVYHGSRNALPKRLSGD